MELKLCRHALLRCSLCALSTTPCSLEAPNRLPPAITTACRHNETLCLTRSPTHVLHKHRIAHSYGALLIRCQVSSWTLQAPHCVRMEPQLLRSLTVATVQPTLASQQVLANTSAGQNVQLSATRFWELAPAVHVTGT